MHRSLRLLGPAEVRAPLAPLPVLAKGFRPFFLLAALHAVLIVPAWLAILHGVSQPSAYLPPSAWHAHEMLWGFTTAVVAGFLLTAVGNWTARETVTGHPLAALALLWVAGRLALLWSDVLPKSVVATIDLAFVPALAFGLARPLIASSNRRNFVMLAILGVLFGTNVVVHLAALGVLELDAARRATLVAVDVVVLLMLVIAGRVFPMFTRNATGVASIRSLPWLDRACAVSMVLLTCVDAVAPSASRTAGGLAALTGVLAAARARHWGSRYSGRASLLWILHAGYGWLVLGLLLRGAGSILDWPIGTAALHALTVGAIGSLTLGMMARVALGHTGRMLAAPPAMTWAFASMTFAALCRVLVPLLAPASYGIGLTLAGAFWTVGFAVFLWCYAPILWRPRVDGRAG